MERSTGTFTVKSGLADMLKGGVIMDVTNAEQARIAEDAGACAVMALERVPADIRAEGGVSRMSDPEKIMEIMDTRHHPCHGQSPYRALCRGANPRSARASTSSTKAKCSRPPMKRITSTNGTSPCPSSVAAATWAKLCAALRKAQR